MGKGSNLTACIVLSVFANCFPHEASPTQISCGSSVDEKNFNPLFFFLDILFLLTKWKKKYISSFDNRLSTHAFLIFFYFQSTIYNAEPETYIYYITIAFLIIFYFKVLFTTLQRPRLRLLFFPVVSKRNMARTRWPSKKGFRLPALPELIIYNRQ